MIPDGEELGTLALCNGVLVHAWFGMASRKFIEIVQWGLAQHVQARGAQLISSFISSNLFQYCSISPKYK